MCNVIFSFFFFGIGVAHTPGNAKALKKGSENVEAATEAVETANDVLSAVVPLSSLAPVAAAAEKGDGKAFAMAIPFVVIDVGTMGKGSGAIKAAKGGGQGGLNLFKWGAEQTGKSTGWKAGDYMLHLPNKGTPALNWKANYGALRSEMNLGKPIFDSYRLPNGNLIPTGGFLNAERYILQTRGWMYSPGSGAWMPPIR